VLEIGCGVGIDTARFARAGARVTSIDLTEAGVALTRQLLELDGLHGDIAVGNAERLPFADDSFDLVYSCHYDRIPIDRLGWHLLVRAS
jgi:ubiquinone/menaquinone biosynthesis C-methylase UbiE